MKTTFLSLLLLGACNGGTVYLEPTESTQQRETALCSAWQDSFCGSGLPAENELEKIREIDALSIALLEQLDLACISVLDSAHVASTPADAEHPDVVTDHCKTANAFLATFIGSYSVELATCTPTTVGCPDAPIPATTCSGGSVTVVDKTGTHAAEALVANKALRIAVMAKDRLESMSALAAAFSSNVQAVSQVEPACLAGAVSRVGDATTRISAVTRASGALVGGL